MNLPFAQGVDPDSGTNALMAGIKLAQQKKQAAAENLLGQQRLQLEQQRMQAENFRAQAESKRADAAGRREDRMMAAQERAQRMQSASAVLPYLDPNSPSFNPEMAKNMAGMAGLGMTQVQGPQTPPPQAPQEPQAPAFNGPIPSEHDARAGALSGTRTDNPDHAGQTMAFTMDRHGNGGQSWLPSDNPGALASPAANQAAQEAAQQEMERQQYAQQLAEAPQRQAKYHSELADYQQRKQFPTYQLDMGDGNPLTIDTHALHRQAEDSRQMRVQKYQEAYADDPEAAKIVVPMAALGVGDKEIAAHLSNLQGKREALANKNDLAAQYQLTADQKYRLGVMNADAHRTSANAGAGAKQDAAAARAQSLLGQAEGRAEKMVDWKGMVGMDNTMRSLMANVDSPNVLQSRDAQIQLGRVFRGTTPTEGEMKLLYDNLGGTADKWNQFVAHLENGGLSDEQKRQLKASAETAHGELEHRKARAFEALKTGFGPGSGFEVMGPQVNAMLKSHGQAVGVDVPDLYDASQSGPGAVVLGSRKPKGKPANPLLNAGRNAKIQKMAPEDRAAVDWADKHPDDPRATNILRLHGL